MRWRAFLKWAVLPVVLLLLLGSLPIRAAEDEVYFTALNDTLLKLNDKTMPFSRYGKYYMPYSIFNESWLGVYYTYNKEKFTLTFYNRYNTLVFDLLQDYAYDLDQQYWERTIYKNDTLYIPIEFVCEEFGLEFHYISPTFSSIPILRVVNESSLDDYSFQVKYSNRLISERNAYYFPPSPSSSPTPTPSPAPGGSQTTPPAGPEFTEVSLVFDCDTSESIADVLDLLGLYGGKAAFFLSETLISDERDIVRRIIGSGHRLGILADAGPASDGEGTPVTDAEQVKRINGILDTYTCAKTRFVRFTPLSGGGDISYDRKLSLLNAGYIVCEVSVAADAHSPEAPGKTASKIIEAGADLGEPPVIGFRLSTDTSAVLGNLLRYFQNSGIAVVGITQVEDR